MTPEEIGEIMNEHDVDHNHEITFEEFKDMILNHMWREIDNANEKNHKSKNIILIIFLT